MCSQFLIFHSLILLPKIKLLRELRHDALLVILDACHFSGSTKRHDGCDL